MIILATIRTTGAEGIVTLQEVGSEYSSIGLIPLSPHQIPFFCIKTYSKGKFLYNLEDADDLFTLSSHCYSHKYYIQTSENKINYMKLRMPWK